MKTKQLHPSVENLESLRLVSHATVQPEYLKTADPWV